MHLEDIRNDTFREQLAGLLIFLKGHGYSITVPGHLVIKILTMIPGYLSRCCRFM